MLRDGRKLHPLLGERAGVRACLTLTLLFGTLITGSIVGVA
jgi:hypothetical protein